MVLNASPECLRSSLSVFCSYSEFFNLEKLQSHFVGYLNLLLNWWGNYLEVFDLRT